MIDESYVCFARRFALVLSVDEGSSVAILIDFVAQERIAIADWSVVELCAYAATPVSVTKCIALLCKHNIAIDIAERSVNALRDAGVLVAEEGMKSFPMWRYYGWNEAAVYHRAAQSTRCADDVVQADADQIRTEVLRQYLVAPDKSCFLKTETSGSALALPVPKAPMRVSLADILLSRKTVRSYRSTPVSKEIFSGILLYGTSGARSSGMHEPSLIEEKPLSLLSSRFVAFELLVVVHNVEDVPCGVYRYSLLQHSLNPISVGDLEEEVIRINWGQPMSRRTTFGIFITAVFERYMSRYRYSNAYRNLLINLGEIGQALILAAGAFGLATCMTPALRDSDAEQMLHVDGRSEQVLYYLGFGVERSG
jgi:SagB-type dehydrogenase family enzyme